MIVKLTTRLLSKAARSASANLEMQRSLADAFEARYGISYQEIKCNWLIDTLDYGVGARVTLADCDRLMAEAGHPKLEQKP